MSTAQKNIDSLETVFNKTINKEQQITLAITLANAYLPAKKIEQVETYQAKAIEAAKVLDNSDILRKTYIDVGNIYITQLKYEQGIEMLSEGLKHATQSSQKAIMYGYQFDVYYRMGQADKGFKSLEKMRENIGNDTLSVAMAEYYFSLSNYYGAKEDILNLLTYLKKAKKNFQYNEEEHHRVSHNLAIAYEDIQAYDKVLEIQAELLAFTQKNEMYFSELFCHYAIMMSHYGLKDYEASKATCQLAINLKDEQGVSSMFGYAYYILGNTYLETNQLDSAEYFYNEGIAISEKQNEEAQLIDNYRGLTKLFFRKKEWAKAKEYGEKAFALINHTNTELNYLLAQIYEKEGNFKKSNQFLKANWEHQVKKEENQSNFKIIASLLDEQYEQEKQQEAMVYEQNLQRQKQCYIGGILLLGLLLAAIIIFLQIRNNGQLKLLNEALQNTNQQLEQANYELRTFNYIASHDIKEPIRNIGGHAGLIFRKLPADLKESLGSYFDTIRRSTTELYTLIEDFANYTTMSKNETIETQEVDLNYLTSSVIENLQESIQKYNGQVLFSDLPTIQSSNSLLFATLKNLIGNGLKYNESEQPTVEVSYNKTEKHHQIIVSDNGIGISEEYYERIFEMFKRLHNRGEYEGSGIGLAIVKLSVDKLGGTVNLESEEGKGSRFVISIPNSTLRL
jgi:signal transduction histidine kinase